MKDHLNIAKTIIAMILDGWNEDEIAKYLSFVYRDKTAKQTNSWDGVVDKQSGAFTQEEIDHKGWL
jgi:rRNA processing protein Krr1/Pno1